MKRFYLLILLSFFSSSCLAEFKTQAQLAEFTQNTELWFSVTDNLLATSSRFKGQIELVNNSTQALPAGAADWIIYFHFIRKIPTTESAGLKIEHIQGDLYKLAPTTIFNGLPAGKGLTVYFEASPWMISYSDFMPRAFMVAAGLTPEIFLNTDTEDFKQFVRPLTEPRQLLRNIDDGDKIATMTNEQRFAKHADAAKKSNNSTQPNLAEAAVHRIIPQVQQLTMLSGHSKIDAHWQIITTKETTAEGQYLQQQLQQLYELALPLQAELPANSATATLSLTVDAKLKQAERYQLSVRPNAITIIGNDAAGVFYGIQSLLALAALPENKSSNMLTLPTLEIDDAPRYPWRGMHYDMARNFHGLEVTKRLIAQMGRYKLNKLHLHLTEDEGWRIEIPGLPELTEIGAIRCFDLTEQQCLLTQLGTGPHPSGSGNGFYRRAEFIELLKFARTHHIEVIPEIDLPGHARAAIKAMEARYQHYNMAEQAEEALRYRLTENVDNSEYLSVQRYTDNAVNVCQESTYAFIDKVIAELQLMYQEAGLTLTLFHMGGDEVAKGAWEHAPACQDLIKTHPQVNSIADLKPYFINRVAELANNRDLALAAWEDGLMADPQTPFPRQQFNNKHVLVNAWDNIWEWGYGDRAYVFANAGYHVVQSAGTNLYFDHPQEAHPEERGYYWATRYNDTERVFFYRPDHLYHNAELKRDGTPITDLAALLGRPLPALEKPENMLGIQGQVWSETIRTAEQLEQMIYPRLLALAERAWHRGSWEPEKASDSARADWQSFANRLSAVELTRLQLSGSMHYLPAPGAQLQQQRWHINLAWPNLIAEYSQDQGLTWQIYNQPLRAQNKVILVRSRLGEVTSRVIML
ncbi:beta-N-acetylhexosaminidase [Alishewanella longhuensis]|uniref:beta-N-acetylhexosaminidase n=1 Tax=Alishewanella longhuensis TaxID=1091037 RepID=A0ABQ3KVJ2_9ALTE|nr:family 20 glycosylhydrolase [Alishewanella longhuensis]GHG62823.1 beta-N-acetylhexosaminidase [Alishewanella longhuensis]